MLLSHSDEIENLYSRPFTNGAEENISTPEGGSGGRLEKTA